MLAPVGGEEQLKAAVRCGADAVYFGLQNFNARRNADNFNSDNLEQTIKYCHDREVKVYITVNTLIQDKELSEMRKTVDKAVAAKADGLIVQDLAVFNYAKGKISLSASTQMAIHNVAGAKLAKEMGFDRIVLARELSLEEIKKICSSVDIDVECFVHGAHCMSVSGNCYLSAMIGGRSGNRGLCAQPCRLDWACNNRDHCLSLKDLSYVNSIQDLVSAGVKSFKIEGRMKRPEYVAAAVTTVKAALESKPYDMNTLQAVFSRQGFTDGYLKSKRDKDMFGYRTKEDVVAAADVLKDLAKLYEHETYFRDVDMKFVLKAGEPAVLFASSAERKAKVVGAIPEKAIKVSLDEAHVRKSLEKTGGTVYKLNNLDCEIEDGLMLSASELNKMRRDVLDAL
ncbi:MAG: U32 family peptidase [Bacillota bacterium]|nr:U32 family peptidase [Bacillota bacterium]